MAVIITRKRHNLECWRNSLQELRDVIEAVDVQCIGSLYDLMRIWSICICLMKQSSVLKVHSVFYFAIKNNTFEIFEKYDIRKIIKLLYWTWSRLLFNGRWHVDIT